MKDSFIMYTQYKEQLDLLTNEQKGILLDAMLLYQMGEDLPGMDAITTMCFSFIRSRIDRDNEAYEEKCRQNAENGKKGGRPKKNEEANGSIENQTVIEETERFLEKPKKADIDIDNDIDIKEKVLPSGNTKKKSAQRFTPPTAQEVQEYADQRGYSAFSAERFIDFYESKGWMVGKNKMKDWKATVRNWNARDQEAARSGTHTASTKFSNFEERSDTDWDAIELAMIRKSMEPMTDEEYLQQFAN